MHCMRITSIRFHGTRDRSFLSYVSVVFDDVFLLKGLKIIERPSDKQRLLAMPTRTRTDGTHEDIAHPIRPDFRDVMTEAIFTEYDRQMSAQAAANGPD